MPNWRDELIEAAKTKAEREAEELVRHKKRVEEALAGAEAAMAMAVDALRFARDRLKEKIGEVTLTEEADTYRLTVRELSLGLELSRESAIIKVTYVEGKPREFDFATMTGFQALEGNEHMTAGEIEAKIREGYRRFYRRPSRILRELRDPRRFAGRVARYLTLFRRRAVGL